MIDHFQFLMNTQTEGEDDYSVAVVAAFPLRPRCRAGEHLSGDGRVLLRSRPILLPGGARLRRCRLPLPAARRGQSRLSVRPDFARAHQGARRRSGRAARHLCRHDQCGDCRYSGRHDHHHASVPRQFPLELRRRRRLRAGRRIPVQQHQGARLFHGIRYRARRRFRAAAFWCRRTRRSCLGSSPANPARSKAATISSGGSTKPRNTFRSISFACRRNAALPRPRKEMFCPRASNGRSCARSSRSPRRCGSDYPLPARGRG